MMNAIYVCVHMLGAGFALRTAYRLGKAFWDLEPSSKDKREEGMLLIIIVGVLFIVNFFFWVPDYYSADFGELIAGVVVVLRSVLTIAICIYISRFYLRDFRFKYNLSFVVFKNSDSPMEQYGELVPLAECEDMIARFKKNFPDWKENFFYDISFAERVMKTQGAEKLILVPGQMPDGQVTIMLFPGDADLNRIPMRKSGGNLMRMLNDEDDDDGEYGGDRAGTTPPGKG